MSVALRPKVVGLGARFHSNYDYGIVSVAKYKPLISLNISQVSLS